MTEEEKHFLIFEALNQVSPVSDRIRKDLDRMDKDVRRVQKNLAENGFGFSDRDVKKVFQILDKSLKDYHRTSVALQKQRDREEKADARRIIQIQIQDAKRLAAEQKRASDLRHLSAMQAIRSEERARRAALQAEKRQRDLMHASAVQAIRAEERAAREAAQAAAAAQRNALARRNAGFSAVGGILGGIGGTARGVASIGNIGLSAVGRAASGVGMVAGIAGQVGGMIQGAISTALHQATAGATALGGALTLVGGIVAKIGTDFNTFKENTLLTLEAMTKSGDRARKIFKDAFQLSVPAKFTFEEILEGFRTMEAFGLRSDAVFKGTMRTAGTLAAALAQGMEKPLAQVTRFLGNLSQGRYLLQQAAPLGLGREEMARHGAEFDSRGAPVDRSKLLGAALKAIEDRWGNLIELMEGTYESALDSMVSHTRMFFGRLTEDLFGGLTNAFRFVSDIVKNIFESTNPQVQVFVKALQMPFKLIGNLVQEAASRLPDLIQGVAKFVTVGNIADVFAHVAATVQILAEEFGKFLSALGGGKGWEGFKDAAKGALDFVYRGWNAFVAGVEYVMKNSDKLWGFFTAASKTAMTAIEIMVGTVAFVIEAQLTGAITNVIKNGADAIGNFFKNLPKILSGGKVNVSAIFGRGGGAGGGAGRVNLSSPFANQEAADLLKQNPTALLPDAGGVSARIGKAIEDGKNDPFKSYSVSGIFRQSQAHGQFIISQMGQALEQIGKQMPQEIRDFIGQFGDYDNPDFRKRTKGSGFLGAMQDAARENSIDRLIPRYNGAFLSNRSRIMQLHQAQFRYSGGQAAAAPADGNLAPGHVMGLMPGEAPLPPSRPAEVIDAILDIQKERAKAFGMDERPEFKLSMLPLLKEKITDQVAMVRALQMDAATSTKNEDGSDKTDKDRQEEQLKILAAREAYWKTFAEIAQIQRDHEKQVSEEQKAAQDAYQEAIRAQIDLLPESQRAAALAQQMVPQLRNEQQAILGKLKSVKQGSEEYWKLVTQGYRTEREIQEIEKSAADEKAKQAFDRPKRQFSTLKKLIGLLPQGARGAAMQRLLAPRIQETLQGAQMETDPVERQNKLLDVVDMFTELKESQREADPWKGMFGDAAAQQRQNFLMRGQRGRGRRGIAGRQAALFGAMSPFAPGMQGAGQEFFGGERFVQIINQIGAHATEAEIAELTARALSEALQR